MKDWMRAKIKKPWKRAKGISSNIATTWLNQNAKKKSRRKLKRERRRKSTLERRIAEERCRKYLADFWPVFNNCRSKDERMLILKRAVGFDWWVSKELREKLRAAYKKNGWRFFDGVEIESCGICQERKPEERHHIIMLAYGGINDEINLLAICLECHNYLHPWMKDGRLS